MMISNIPLLMLNGVFYASILFLVASGLTLIFSVAGILNLAHGALYMFGAFVGAYIIKTLGASHSYIIAFPIAAAVVGCMGVAIERFLIKWIYGRHYFYQLLLTFGLALVIGDLTRMIFGSQPISAAKPFMRAGSITILGTPYPAYNFIVIAVTLGVAFSLWYILYKTRAGKVIRACALEREMAEALGINTNRVFALTFFIGTALAGLSGALIVPPTVAMLGMDADALVLSFIVIIIGGVGSLKGAFIGSLIVGIIRAFGIVLFPQIELAIVYLIMIAVLLVRPRGLFGREVRVA